MAKYPQWRAFNRITAAKLDAMLDDIYVKQTGDQRVNTTYAADSELQGILLTVGTHQIIGDFFVTGDTGDVKIRWAFTGSWNTPVRFRSGPDAASAGPTATSVALNGVNTATDATYGLASTTNFASIREWTNNAQVTTEGLLSIEFAKSAASGSDTYLRSHSSLTVRRIG